MGLGYLGTRPKYENREAVKDVQCTSKRNCEEEKNFFAEPQGLGRASGGLAGLWIRVFPGPAAMENGSQRSE